MSEEQEQCDSFNSWELNGLNSLDLWDYTVELECLQGTEDLQLAAELGKTLLERNKELETALRQHQNVIEDQAQEIEYLTKQTVALREVNDSRLRIYEQLEVSIQDLERANHRLAVDHAAEKKHIKTLCANIETLESKCEDLQKTVDDLNAQLEISRRRAERKPEIEKPKEKEKSVELTLSVKKSDVSSTPIKTVAPLPELTKEDEDLLRLSDELRESKVAFAQEQRRVTELEEQLASMVQENNRLHDQFRNWQQREDEPKSMHEEFSILEEVRQGQLCIRCLRGVERGDDMSSMLDGDDDDRSAISSLILPPSGQDSPREDLVTNKLVKFDNAKEKLLQGIWANKEDGHDNPYRELVQKYEALLEVQLSQVKNIRKTKQTTLPSNQNPCGPLSLQDELQTSGDYSQFSVKDTDEESGHGEEAQKGVSQPKKVDTTSRKKIIQTPDFSEAETSSSGFSDETSNKATQTERERPGSFLCTIADGEDYRFSIYDDVSPMDSRFRNRPEYRELFKEIFTILKKAAENKDDGEQLPLLDDTTAGKVPPVTPANEEAPGNFTDDTQSVLSSVMSEQSIPVSDITVPDTPTLKEKEIPQPEVANKEENGNKENKPVAESTTEKPKPSPARQPKEHVSERARDQTDGQKEKEKERKEKERKEEKERVLTPLVRQPLEYIAATRKKSRHRNRKHSQDRQGADSPVFPSPPKITYQKSSNKKRRDYRPIEVSPLARATENEWNGSTLQFYNRNLNSPTPSASGRTGKIYQGWNPETDSWDIKQSTASQEIHKLRKLELSYAEVLRNADKTKPRRKKHQ
ncbi:cerebellar degeneration-related protein 2-like isoform X1 [Trichoplusia ni]|uniref:Cerebellar degeneration-related protein 2-like isoform X1 n=1 Tax=Trichoplusia ni TaxID=7111 RepID=A0A7E5WPI9_TRINI|nr:cerebellar degeneration-related protein 2-like isoform X1 [Trichoplusia ni]